MKIVIVGGVAGGASAAARLRRLDENAEIIMFEKGEFISYANCGLPYFIGGEIKEQSALTLQTPNSFYNRFHIDVRVKNEVIAINKEEKTVTVRKLDNQEIYHEPYDKLILSPGAEPIKPNWTDVDDSRVFTLRNIPDTLKIKDYINKNDVKTAIVIGGGYIGIEMAENLANAGLEVSIVEMADHLIAPLDFDMACDVHHYMRKNGVKLYLKTSVKDVNAKNSNIDVLTSSGIISSDIVILSIGVKPETSLAKDAGIALNERGAILVDRNMRTSCEDIYAVGDAVEITNFVSGKRGYIPLAGPANKQGRIAADHICGISSSYNGTQGSAVAKIFDMTVASTGLNEASAKALEIDYDKVYTFSASHASYYPGAKNMSIKLLFEQNGGKILGAQIVGFEGVDKRCDVISTAIRAKMTVFDLEELELCYAPPFSSAKDPVNMIGFVAENILTKKIAQFFWNDVEALMDRDDVILLDVRTPNEYKNGHINKTMHIPLDNLRENINQLDKSKNIYVNCQSGLRSYIACRILMQNGFKCFNLAGGYRLYESVTKDIEFDETPKHSCGMKI